MPIKKTTLAVYCVQSRRRRTLHVTPVELATIESKTTVIFPRGEVVDQKTGKRYEIYSATEPGQKTRRKTQLTAAQLPDVGDEQAHAAAQKPEVVYSYA